MSSCALNSYKMSMWRLSCFLLWDMAQGVGSRACGRFSCQGRVAEAGMRGLDDVTVLGPRVCSLNVDGGASRVARVAS